MLKLTQKWAFLLLLAASGCQNPQDEERYQQAFRRKVDAAAEARIDSAYTAIQRRCDSLLTYQVPLLADSIVKAQDSIRKAKTVNNGQ